MVHTKNTDLRVRVLYKMFKNQNGKLSLGFVLFKKKVIRRLDVYLYLLCPVSVFTGNVNELSLSRV